MAEIRNYTMNFSFGRAERLTCYCKLACTEIHCERTLLGRSIKGENRG